MDELASFGEWLKRRRSALLLSREELAQQVGCAVVTLRKIEADERRPSQQIAERLAERLELADDQRLIFVKVARAELPLDRLPPARPYERAIAAPPATTALPSGTVTFLFTDIEGSTQLWEQHPQAMPHALARHDTILQHAIAATGGLVFKMVGDGCHAVFVTAAAALAAALAAQRALIAEQWETTEPLRVRMALHSGVAEIRDGDYFGQPLNRLARLLAAGHGGQILLSLATAELVREQLPPDAALRDLGTHRLKDLSYPEQIFQLLAPDLPTAFPPLNALDPRRTNLPTQPTLLIGREQEVAAVCDLLRRADVRLLTLTGPGGTGKTRLGLQVAAELLDAFVDGIYFVDLAPIGDANLVVSTIAQTLGLTERGDQPLLERLQSYLRDKRLLLLLDNFEQVLDAAPLVAALLAACPQLKVLVTSRAPLQLRGEQEYPVPPLNLPDLHRLPELAALSQYAAVALFIQRARAVQPDFAVTNATAPAVAEICHRLDGLPLAIELAATRVKLLPLPALLARLDNRLKLLTGGARDQPERQQTIRATIEWSYDLLEADAQPLFRRLAVFVGGCTLEAVEAVCNASGDLPMAVVDGIAGLLDQSLLRQEAGADGEPRFVMLETIREYALERLAAGGEAETAQQRHAEYHLTLVERAEGAFRGPQARTWIDRLEADHDNLRAALTWSQSVSDAALGLRLAGALWEFWRARGYWSEGRDWLTGLLALAQHADASSTLRAKAFHGAGVLANCQGDYARADILCKQSLVLFRKVEDKRGMAWALNELGYVAQEQSDHEQATVCFQESLTLFRKLGDKHGIAESLDNLGRMARDQSDYARATTLFQESLTLFRELQDKRGVALALKSAGNMAWLQGNYATARSVFEESLPLFRELGDSWGTALSLNHLGMVEREQGAYRAARSLHEESLALRRALGDKTGIAYSLHDLGVVAHRQGDNAQARTLLEESLDMFRRLRDTGGIALALNTLGHVTQSQGEARRAASLFLESLALYQALEFKPGIAGTLAGLASVAGATGQPERAARLFGAAAALRETTGTPLLSINQADYERDIATIRAQLDDATFAAAWAAGAAMTLEQAIAFALDEGS